MTTVLGEASFTSGQFFQSKLYRTEKVRFFNWLHFPKNWKKEDAGKVANFFSTKLESSRIKETYLVDIDTPTICPVMFAMKTRFQWEEAAAAIYEVSR